VGGIPGEASTYNKVIKTCFDEIYKARPYFIGIVGDSVFFKPENVQFSYFCFKNGKNKDKNLNKFKDKIRMENST